MTEVFELIMLICFGISWPISVYKSIKSKSTQGKSVVFIFAIIIGYISGITGKILAGKINYVLIAYCLNLLIVSVDLVLFFVNKHREKEASKRVAEVEKKEANNVFVQPVAVKNWL